MSLLLPLALLIALLSIVTRRSVRLHRAIAEAQAHRDQ